MALDPNYTIKELKKIKSMELLTFKALEGVTQSVFSNGSYRYSGDLKEDDEGVKNEMDNLTAELKVENFFVIRLDSEEGEPLGVI